MGNKAAVFGSTGLIGSNLIKILEADSDFISVIAPTRKNTSYSNKKIKNKVIDFKDFKSYVDVVEGCESVFIAIGTTQSKVKWDKKKYIEIDYGIPINIARACEHCKVNKIVLVSSAGANINEKNFYISLKGKIEKDIINYNIDNIYIMRPSLLLGERTEKRFGEKIAQVIMPLFSSVIPKIYRPIHAKDVAQSMIDISKNPINSCKIYHYEEMMDSNNL